MKKLLILAGLIATALLTAYLLYMIFGPDAVSPTRIAYTAGALVALVHVLGGTALMRFFRHAAAAEVDKATSDRDDGGA